MKRLLFLPLLVLPLLILSCDGEIPAEPEQTSLTPLTADVTMQGLVTNTVEIAVKCSHGVTRTANYKPVGDVRGYDLYCPADADTLTAAAVSSGVDVWFNLIVGAPADCQGMGSVYPVPSRVKCTVNGKDVGGKPLAVVTIKYIKD